MAAALSETEFHRMQLQLIELRTKNYELEGKSKQQDRELSGAVERIEILNKELSKTKLAISKSKRAKDVEVLIQESDSLQHKLQSQEEEFRLQNQTLMEELSLLVSNNEELKKELENAKKSGGNDPASSGAEKNGDLEDDIRRLQAENSALQKNLSSLQERLDRESTSKKGNTSNQSFVEEDSMTQGDLGVDETDSRIEHKGVEDCSQPEDQGDVVNALQLKLDTEMEEKKLIKNQLDSLTKDNKETVASLQDEIDKLSDKFKKKQESFLQLHAEKETVAKESSAKLEEQQAARDRDQKYYKDQIAKLQAELEKNRQELEQQHSLTKSQTAGLENKITELHNQVSATSVVNTHQMKEQSDKFLAEIATNKESLALLAKEKEDLATQLRESQQAAHTATTQLHETLVEKDKQIAAVQETSKLAEKRKVLVDEMAIKYQKEFDSHREDVGSLEKKREEEVAKLEEVIAEQKRKLDELSKNVPILDELQGKVRSLEDAKGWLERRLAEVEEDLKKAIASHQEEMESNQSSHATEMETASTRHAEEVTSLNAQMADSKADWEGHQQTYKEEIQTLKADADKLRQEIKDSHSEKKIHEKKGMTMLKDLKRQLHAERKRAEKLQTKLQEILTDNQGKGVDELFRHSNSTDFLSGETSSVSSWGASASGLGKDSVASGPQSPMSANNSFVSEVSVGEEYMDLLKRVGNLQQEKWALEEKVQHLECSNSCMAEDLLKKASIIEHYVMDARSGRRQSTPSDDKISLKKVRDLINKNADHTQQTQDMNKKLQAMLEETLTKNMHLQKDLEMMSQEVVRLSKLSALAAINSPTAAAEPTQTRSSPTNKQQQQQPSQQHQPPSVLPLSSSHNNQKSNSNTATATTTTTTTSTSPSSGTPTIVVRSVSDENDEDSSLTEATTSTSANAAVAVEEEEAGAAAVVTSPTDTNISDGNFEMISSSELDNVSKSPTSSTSTPSPSEQQDTPNTQGGES